MAGRYNIGGMDMKREDLKEYLGIVVDMEENIFMQKTLISNIEREIEQLKIPKIFSDPIKPVEPERPKKNSSVASTIIFSVIGCIVLFFLSCIGILIISGIVVLFRYGNLDYAASAQVQNLLEPLIIIIPTIWIVYCISKELKSRKQDTIERKKYADTMETYKKDLEAHKKAIEMNCFNRQQDERIRLAKTIFLNSQRTAAIKSLASTTEYLKKIYAKDIIFPKYRNLVMACSLYEYICAGRCDTLEGHEGAYNILETEIRLDRIISQLDQVITHLEKIQQNQFMLYSAIQNSNQRLSQIMDSTNHMASRLDDFYNGATPLNDQTAELNARIAELQASSTLTAYHAERTQKELAYMNRINYLSGRNDDVFFNHPPV